MSKAPPNLLGLSRTELEELAVASGQQRYRGRQLYRGLYARALQNFDEFTNLDRSLREKLASEHAIVYPRIVNQMTSKDQSIRYLLGLADGEAVEAVYMPWRLEQRRGRPVATPSGRELEPADGPSDGNRTTLCISSQVGCAVDCRFCFTGLLGARRNLTAGEIVGQVLAIARDRGLFHQSAPKARRINIVFMGQGEPLLNFSAVMKAVRILADTDACAVPLRRITISTAGIVPRIGDLGREPVRPKLAVSLNASNDEQRNALMPINRKYPLRVLLDACRAYPLRPREHLTFEYVMLDGVNDSEDDAVRVAHLLNGLTARVNLIPYNGGTALSYRPSPLESVYRFEHVLREKGVPAFIRISRGQDIMAACGQLSLAGRN
ncbi:MAG TPA: 23S rRNA (adenine(2503)-C(2))-methyltransferase RlmN [Terriglobia bacterium]|nr:23S rRNA (adenine(2503)-C(2))-methyltransferase RlmN [Terriglobia bacterium]